MMKKVAVVFTGGTISMKVDPRLKAAIPSMSSQDIMSMVTNIDQIAELDIVEFGALPGPHMTPEKMMELKQVVENKLKQEDISGEISEIRDVFHLHGRERFENRRKDKWERQYTYNAMKD